MAQPPTQADGGSSTDPRPALEDAAIVIHADGYDLIEIGDVEPTESEAVQHRIDELPEEPGGAAFNADAHPDHSSVELVDATYSFDVAATLRLAHVESGRFDVLRDDQLVMCVNPEYDYLTWFYEAGNDDGMVAEYHETADFEAGTIERSKALASIASAEVNVSIVDREVLDERRERGEAMADGGEVLTGDGGADEGLKEPSPEELAVDDQAVRLLGNAKITLWDIDRDELTRREQNRLSTVLDKIGELEDIVQERKEAENR